MKKVGIWIDKKNAHLITLLGEKETFETIVSDVDDFRIGGGSGTRVKGGPQDVVQDSKYLEREKHQLKAYFTKVINKVKDADVITIFGPAEAGLKLQKEIQENHKTIATKLRALEKTDSMTENQTRALVRDYFKES